MSASTWRVLSGYATYQRTPIRMTSGGKCAPLKLIAIVVLPHDVPLVMEEDHTAKGLKRKLATKPDDGLAIEQRAHQAVLETKLGLQRALRVGAIGVLEP